MRPRGKETWVDIPLWRHPEPYTSLLQDGRKRVLVKVLVKELPYNTLCDFRILEVVGLRELLSELSRTSMARSLLRHLVLDCLVRELGVSVEKLKGIHRIISYSDKLQGRL